MAGDIVRNERGITGSATLQFLGGLEAQRNQASDSTLGIGDGKPSEASFRQTEISQ